MCFTLWNICLCVCVLVHRVRGFQKRWVKLDVDYLSYFDNDKVTTSMYSNTNTFTLITFNRDLHQKRDASSMPVLLKHPVCNGSGQRHYVYECPYTHTSVPFSSLNLRNASEGMFFFRCCTKVHLDSSNERIRMWCSKVTVTLLVGKHAFSHN